MAHFNAGNLDNRNLGSRITVRRSDETIFGIIATIKRRSSEVEIMLSDNETTLRLAPSESVEIHLSGPDLALVNMVGNIERIEDMLLRMQRGESRTLNAAMDEAIGRLEDLANGQQ